MDIQNPEKIEIEGLKTIHKLCKFGVDHNMEGCSFTEIVERMFSKIEQMKTQVNTLDEILLNQGEALAQTKAKAVPEGFVLVKASDIAKLAIAVSRVDLMTYSEERPDSEKLAWQNVANKLEAMIEAQENS